MEDLFGILVIIIGIIASIVSSARKEKAKRDAAERRLADAAASFRTAAKQMTAPVAKPVTMMPSMAVSDVPGQVIAPVVPTVHPHVQPDCEIHDRAGSLGVVSTEGKDPCHEEQLSMMRSSAEVPQEEGGLTFDWSGDNMVKAFVMQEVLSRPVQRHRR